MRDNEILRKYAYYPMACLDACIICYRNIEWINKFGGEIARSEGVKLLNRIIKRLLEAQEKESK